MALLISSKYNVKKNLGSGAEGFQIVLQVPFTSSGVVIILGWVGSSFPPILEPTKKAGLADRSPRAEARMEKASGASLLDFMCG